MTIEETIEYCEERARQERAIAATSTVPEARRAHLRLAMEHERAAERERERGRTVRKRLEPTS